MTTPARVQIPIYMSFSPTSVTIYDAETGEVYASTNQEACDWLADNGKFITSTERHSFSVVLMLLTVNK